VTRRWVDVAVDAAGPAGGQAFTYHLPPRLSSVAPGEAVLVEYGRRQALGVVLAERTDDPGRETKPVLARVRSDGPLVPPLQLELARHVSSHYLAPPVMVVRQMLPVGLLERVELVARAAAAPEEAEGADDLLAAIAAAGDAGVAADDLPRGSGRAALLRQLHGLERQGSIELEWRVRPAQASERLQRQVSLTDAGRRVADGLTQDEEPPGPRLGERQKAVLAELLTQSEPQPAARLAERHGTSAIPGLARRGLVTLETVRLERRPLEGRPAAVRGTRPIESELTRDQRAALDRVTALLDARRHGTILLEGTTASGKSAVYAAAIAAALEQGRGAMVLVPEIALAVPLLDRLRHDLGVEVALLHSALGDGERADEWRRIRSGDVRVVVGTRIAVLAPLADPGVIVVDEEHDPAYKSDRTPRYQARDVAIELGRLADAPVVLGSATPDVASIGRARLGLLEHIRLPRVAGARPTVEVVDLRAELAEGNRGLLSRSLAGALGELDTTGGEQAILLINRRGSASVVICRDCGYVQICPECQRPLVFHASTLALRCHHCGASAPIARRCPACDSVRIRYLGGGTQRVEREVAIRFPGLRVGRLDRDVVERKGEAARVVDAFSGGELDVLVGTALVAKGLDVPQVTLVGVVSADVALNLPDERAAERTYQLLAQVVGRAGRGYRPGRAIIQTYLPLHPAIRAVADDNPQPFYDEQLASRELFGSPPFGEVIKLTVALEDRTAAEREAADMAVHLRERAIEAATAVQVMGPVPAYVVRRAGKWRFHVVLRGDRPLDVLGGDPGPPWSVDVDPESLL
jgi:primosomal protein N' (replication factor Y)